MRNPLSFWGDTAESFYEKILINKEENRRLAKLCDWLVPMLMNGQVEVETGTEDKKTTTSRTGHTGFYGTELVTN